MDKLESISTSWIKIKPISSTWDNNRLIELRTFGNSDS